MLKNAGVTYSLCLWRMRRAKETLEREGRRVKESKLFSRIRQNINNQKAQSCLIWHGVSKPVCDWCLIPGPRRVFTAGCIDPDQCRSASLSVLQAHRCHERFRILKTATVPVHLFCVVFSTVKGAEENTPEFHYWAYSTNKVRYWKSITRNMSLIWIPNWWPEGHDQFYTAVAWMSYVPLAIWRVLYCWKETISASPQGMQSSLEH